MCIHEAFLQNVSSYGFSNLLEQENYNHIYCTCVAFLQNVQWYVFLDMLCIQLKNYKLNTGNALPGMGVSVSLQVSR